MRLNEILYRIETICSSKAPAKNELELLLELCGACEQLSADSALGNSPAGPRYYQLARRWLSHAAEVCSARWPTVSWNSDLAARILATATLHAQSFNADRSAEQYAKLPECFTRDLTAIEPYLNFVDALLDDEFGRDGLLIVGVRTTGSYLAPLWMSVVKRRGIVSAGITTRPKRPAQRSDKPRDWAPGELLLPSGDEEVVENFLKVAGSRAHAVVVDDLAFTGMSFLMIERFLLEKGFQRDRIRFSQNAPLVMTVMDRSAKVSLSRSNTLVPPRTATAPSQGPADFFSSLLERRFSPCRVRSVELLQPTYEQKFLARHLMLPIDEVIRFSPRSIDRKYRLSVDFDGEEHILVAKIAGVGALVESDLTKIAGLGAVAYRPFVHLGGYLFYEWVDGDTQPFGTAHISIRAAESLGEHCALVSQATSIGEISANEFGASLLNFARSIAIDETLRAPLINYIQSVLNRTSRSGLPQVDKARNQAHWHYLVNNRTRNVTRVHQERGEWSLQMDIAEDIASMRFELGLSETSFSVLLEAYIAASGDSGVVDRLELGLLAHLLRLLSNYAFWRAKLALMPARFRRFPEMAKPRLDEREEAAFRDLTELVIANVE